MRVDAENKNVAFLSLIENPNQVVFLDANFFIPPDRSEVLRNQKIGAFSFEDFKNCWLDPLLSEFLGLSIHESVYEELVDSLVKEYADSQIGATPSRLKIFSDVDLSTNEKILMMAFVDKLAIHSQYDPIRDNAKDRGEILSLSYMATKGFLYFAAKDGLPIRLIKEADKLNTGLSDMGIVQMYELIYYLYKKGKYDGKMLRILYKYLYFLTVREKRTNPEWGDFVGKMDKLYGL